MINRRTAEEEKIAQLSSLSMGVSVAASRIYRGRLLLNKQEQEALFQMEEQLKQEAEILINPEAKMETARIPVGYILDLVFNQPESQSLEDTAATLGALATELRDLQHDKDPIIAKAMADQYRELSVHARGKLAEPGEKIITGDENQLSFDE